MQKILRAFDADGIAGAVVASTVTFPKPPQLRAARRAKQSVIKFVILFVTLAFLFVPLLAMLIFTLRHPLSGRWSAAPWIAIFTGNGESLGADLTVLWQGRWHFAGAERGHCGDHAVVVGAHHGHRAYSLQSPGARD